MTHHWTCRDGRVLLISEMDTDHLLNAHRMVVRQANMLILVGLQFAARLVRLGAPDDVVGNLDGRQDDLDAAMTITMDKENALRAELKRRGARPLACLGGGSLN